MKPTLHTVRGLTATAALAATCTTVAPALMAPAAQAATTMRATTDVYVHATPANAGRIVTVARGGQDVTVTGRVGNWIHVGVNGHSGYIYKRFLTTSGSASRAAAPAHTSSSRSAATSTSGARGSAWTTTGLHLRTSGSMSARILTVLPRGTELNRTGATSGPWVQVTSSRGNGWVHSAYLTTHGSSSSSSSKTSATSTRSTASTSRSSSRADISGSCSASYYDEPQMTASGERFDPSAMTAAHKTLPLGTRVKVTNSRTGASTVVRINDRGPYVAGRCLDLSKAAFASIADISAGVTPVTYTVLS